MKTTLAVLAFGMMASTGNADDHQPYEFLKIDYGHYSDGKPSVSFKNCDDGTLITVSQMFLRAYSNETLVGQNKQAAIELIEKNIPEDEIKRALAILKKPILEYKPACM